MTSEGRMDSQSAITELRQIAVETLPFDAAAVQARQEAKAAEEGEAALRILGDIRWYRRDEPDAFRMSYGHGGWFDCECGLCINNGHDHHAWEAFEDHAQDAIHHAALLLAERDFEALTAKAQEVPESMRVGLARLLDRLYGLHFRPGHLDAVLDVVQLHAPVKVSLTAEAAEARVQELEQEARWLVEYRDKVGPLGFQLEKADYWFDRLRAALAESGKITGAGER